jgi:hypothetical protein
MKKDKKYFIEQYRDIRYPDKLIQTPEPTPIAYLADCLKCTENAPSLKTIAVWIITPKTIDHDNKL